MENNKDNKNCSSNSLDFGRWPQTKIKSTNGNVRIVENNKKVQEASDVATNNSRANIGP